MKIDATKKFQVVEEEMKKQMGNKARVVSMEEKVKKQVGVKAKEGSMEEEVK